MANEQAKLQWEAFETGGNEEFLKLANGAGCDATFKSVEIVKVPQEDEQGNPKTDATGNIVMKPQLKFVLDSMDGKATMKVWNTGNRQIVAMVKSLVESGAFPNWVYRITKNPPQGNSKYANYTLIQLRLKA